MIGRHQNGKERTLQERRKASERKTLDKMIENRVREKKMLGK